MTVIQFSILRTISRSEQLPLIELAKALVMERTTLYRALAPLERRGWVAIDDADGRAKLARLTERGRKAMADATGAWEDAQRRVIGGLGPGDWARLEKSLSKLVAVARSERR